MDLSVLWSARDWARAIADLPAAGPLPCRTVLVPQERVAHGLRRELLRMGRGEALAGTRFVPFAAAALQVLRTARVRCAPGEEGLRRARVSRLLEVGPALAHFDRELLVSRPGWDEALAGAIGDLEAAGLSAADLTGRGGPLGDVAALWRHLDASADASWSTQRIYREAAQVLARQPEVWPYPGPVLAVVTGGATAAQAGFIRAIPAAMVGLLAARPVRRRYLDRLAALFGEQAARAVAAAPAPRSGASERDILASYLFEPPAVLAAHDRPRSPGPDGTVELSEHAGVEAEIEAAADWVAREALAGTAVEDIAVLVPALDPLAGLVAERLGRLPWTDGPVPVHVAGGLPLTGTVAGARALAVVRALARHLSGEALAAVLPSLRTALAESRHLSRGRATDLVWALGTVGGDPADPGGALEWASRLARREPDLAAQLEQARQAVDDPERSGVARRAQDLERLLEDLRAVRPAVEALVGVARLVVGRAPLGDLWPALCAFLEGWLLQPGDGPPAHLLLDGRLKRAAADPACRTLAGGEALRLIEEAIQAIRLPVGRFGQAAVYVGTLAGAIGLRFAAVRVIGLAEGHLPPLPREDPVIPDALRETLRAPADGRPIALTTRADRSLAALHALDLIVRDAGARVALSAPRLDVDRSLREPSSVILEAAAALGRPSAATGTREQVIPNRAALHRDAFRPARRAALAFQGASPIAEWAWQDGVALGRLGVPPRWHGAAALDLAGIASRAAPETGGALDGIMGPRAVLVPVPGLAPGRPISPSALRKLLECPHQFLLEAMLGFDEPAAAPPQREIGQPAYGALVHLVAQEFYQEHGAAFCRREADREAWLARADAVAERVFAQFLEQYPLVGGAVRGQQRNRLGRDVEELIRYDWQHAGRRFVAVERVFGRPAPLALEAGAAPLYVRGQIDRLDVDGARTLVRDLKTGRAHPRVGNAAAPDPVLDVQLGVYGLAARALAAAWQVPAAIGAAYAYVHRGADERDWRDDFHETLEPAVRGWLAVAGALLAARAFPRTPNAEDCTYCAFRPVCGEQIYERAARLLATGDGALRAFGALKGVTLDAASPADGRLA